MSKNVPEPKEKSSNCFCCATNTPKPKESSFTIKNDKKAANPQLKKLKQANI